MKSEVRACERLSAYFRKFCLEENRARLFMHQGLDGCATRSLFASNLSGFCLTSACAILRAYFFNRDADCDTPFSEGLLADLVPTRRLTANFPVPIEHAPHGLRVRNDLGLTVDLDIIRGVEFLAVHQQ